MDDYYDDDGYYEDYFGEESERDPVVDEAKEHLLSNFFDQHPEKVYYEQQLEVLVENIFFHWITVKALLELVESREIGSEKLEVFPNVNIRFFFSKRNRSWKRSAQKILKLVRQFSAQQFASAIGHNGELLFDQALPREGFLPVGWNTRSYGDKTWTTTLDNLDRIFVRDGTAWGTEIKNTLKYISREEMSIKMQICDYLGIRPLFIVRFAPKSYVEEVRNRGGFVLIFKWQLYPLSHKAFADDVKDKLGLPTDAPRAIQEGTIKRFLKYHLWLISQP